MSRCIQKYSSLLLVAILVIFVIVIGCEKNATDSGMKFGPGKYAGTYQVQTSAYDPPEVDTVKFTFNSIGKFYMKKDTITIDADTLVDREWNFCDVSLFSFHLWGSQLNIDTTNESYIYPQICDPLEVPVDDYTMGHMGNWIVFSGQDDTYRRKIILWELISD